MLEKALQVLSDNWQTLTAAPIAFVVLAILGVAIGFLGATWAYAVRISHLESAVSSGKDEIKRLRVAAGIEEGSSGVLIGLTAPELKAKAFGVARRLKTMMHEFDGAAQALQMRLDARNAPDEQRAGERQALLAKHSHEFDMRLSAEAVSVDTELRRRLGPAALQSIVGLPHTVYSGKAPIGLLSLTMVAGSGMSAAFMGVMAQGIEQMAHLLPE